MILVWTGITETMPFNSNNASQRGLFPIRIPVWANPRRYHRKLYSSLLKTRAQALTLPQVPLPHLLDFSP